MSLLNDMMEKCVIMNKSRVSDGEGGFVTTWSEGAEIMCAIVNETSVQAQIAESQGVTSTYTITTRKAEALDFHDVIKRSSDNAIFRITSNAQDKLSPSVSTLDMAQMKAEKWSLTT